jgi:hypothetical protein
MYRKLKQGSLKITNISVSDTTPPIEVLTIVNGEGDPGYLNTCCTSPLNPVALPLMELQIHSPSLPLRSS